MRRGQVMWVYETIISLVLLALFVVATYSFIAANANGDRYFSRYYATDLSTTAEVVNAGDGDVFLRYDNLRDDLELSFWFENGKIVIGTPSGKAGAVTKYYGFANSYPAGPTREDLPSFLALQQTDGRFTIGKSHGTTASCPYVEPSAIRAVGIEAHTPLESGEQRIKDTMSVILGERLIVGDSGDLNIRIRIESGNRNEIRFAPSDAQGRSIACLFARRLSSLTMISFTTIGPQEGGTGLDITITTTSDVALTEEQVGNALASALAVHYRGST